MAALVAAALALGSAGAGEEANNWGKFKEGVRQAGGAVADGARAAGKSVAGGAGKAGGVMAKGYGDVKEYVREKTADGEGEIVPEPE